MTSGQVCFVLFSEVHVGCHRACGQNYCSVDRGLENESTQPAGAVRRASKSCLARSNLLAQCVELEIVPAIRLMLTVPCKAVSCSAVFVATVLVGVYCFREPVEVHVVQRMLIGPLRERSGAWRGHGGAFGRPLLLFLFKWHGARWRAIYFRGRLYSFLWHSVRVFGH